MSDIICCL